MIRKLVDDAEVRAVRREHVGRVLRRGDAFALPARGKA
jgi:hypothetical protein